MSRIKLIAIMGPAGSGKDTILKEVVKQKPEWHKIVNYTTRPQRENELNHYSYHFINKNEFFEKIAKDEFLEYNEFRQWWYGTSITDFYTEAINISVFSPAAIRKIIRNYNHEIDIQVFRIDASDKTRLFRQLNREEYPNIDEIFRRFYSDKNDFSYEMTGEYFFCYSLRNEIKEDIDKCVKDIIDIGGRNLGQK